jgi:ParB family chromosome partitioning protein
MHREAERNPRKALGKGLSALLPSRQAPAPPTVESDGSAASAPGLVKATLPEEFEEFQSIPLDQIFPGEEQPRTTFDTDKLMELSQSIRMNGVIQPITVHRLGPQKYQIIAGERRWKAAGLAGLKAIPALVRNVEQYQALELALIENIQREDLNPIEVALAFQRLADEHGFSHEQIAEKTGKERSTITNLLRLLRLSPFVRNELICGRISVGHARALLNITNDQAQMDLSKQIVAKQLSVRATEELVKRVSAPGTERLEKQAKEEPKIDPNVRAALDEMAMALGTRVRMIAKSGTSGRLEIEYYSQDDLDRIYSVIVK